VVKKPKRKVSIQAFRKPIPEGFVRTEDQGGVRGVRTNPLRGLETCEEILSVVKAAVKDEHSP